MDARTKEMAVVQHSSLASRKTMPPPEQRYSPLHQKSSTQNRCRPLGGLRALLTPTLALSLTVFTSNHLLSAVAVGGFYGPVGLALILSVVVEVISLWFLVWSVLALLSTVPQLPTRFRSKLAGSVISYAPAAARTIASRALVSTAITGSVLVGPTAFAEDLGSGVDDLLWDSVPVATETLEVASSDMQEVWLPGATPEPLADGSSEVSFAANPDPLAGPSTVEESAEPSLPLMSTVSPDAASTAAKEREDASMLKPVGTLMAPPEPEVIGQGNPASTSRHGSHTGPSDILSQHQFRDLDLTATQRTKGPRQLAVAESTKATTAAQVKTGIKALRYVVEPGDCLWNIAKSQLPQGTQDRDIEEAWKQIYLDNQENIGPDPNLIEPGQTLSLRV